MARPDPDDLSSVLEQRHEYLRAIVERPRSKRDLVKDLNSSDSTTGRALRELKSDKLAQYDDGVWKATPLGQCVCEIKNDYARQLTDHAEVAPVLDRLELDDPLNRSFIDEAEVHTSDSDTSSAVMTRLLDSVERASAIHVATPVLFPGFGETFYERIEDSDCSLEMVVPDEVFECAHGANPSITGTLLNDPNVTLYGGPVSFSFVLWIADMDRAGMTVFGDYGIEGTIVNETADAVTWALKRYEQTRERARPILMRSGTAPTVS